MADVLNHQNYARLGLVPSKHAEMKAANPSLRDRIGNMAYDAANYLGLPAQRFRDKTQFAADFVPGLGDTIGAQEAGRDYQAGNYLNAAIGGGLTALGVVPVVGKAASKGIKQGLDLAMDEASRMARAKEMGFDVDTPVYHGTSKGGFTEFDTDGRGKTDGTGAFFGDLETATTYSGSKNEIKIQDFSDIQKNPEKHGYAVEPDDGGWLATTPDGYSHWSESKEQALIEAHASSPSLKEGVLPVYTKMKDPMIIDAEGANWDAIGGREWFIEDEDGNGLEYFTSEFDFQEFMDNFDGDTDSLKITEQVSRDSPDAMSTDDLARMAREQGYDGLIVKNVVDEGPHGRGYSQPSEMRVAFDPKNIRSIHAKFDPAKKNSGNLLAGITGATAGTAAFMQGNDEAQANEQSLGSILAEALQ